MKKYIFTAIIISLYISGEAQSLRTGFSVTVGMGTYDLAELKGYQDELRALLPVDAKAGQYFPPYNRFKINLFREFETGLNYGISYGYASTGAHANYTDYSGYLNLDQTVTAYSLGGRAGYKLLQNTLFDVGAFGNIRLAYVRDEVNLAVATNYYFENSKLILSSISPFAEVGLEAIFHLKKLSLGLEGGYLLDAGTKFKVRNSDNIAPLIDLDPTGDLHTGMSGVRVGIKAILWLIPGEIE